MQRRKDIRQSAAIVQLFFFSVVLLLLNGCADPENRIIYFNMLDDQNSSPNPPTAEKFLSSIRPASSLADSHYRLGRHYQNNGKHDKAIQAFTNVVHNDDTYCSAYNGIAMSYDALKQCQPASRSYEQALRCAPDEAYVYNNYGCSRLLCGDYEKGASLLLEAERLAEENTRIKNNLKVANTIADQASGLGKSPEKEQ